jgi:hypothetical protein
MREDLVEARLTLMLHDRRDQLEFSQSYHRVEVSIDESVDEPQESSELPQFRRA